MLSVRYGRKPKASCSKLLFQGGFLSTKHDAFKAQVVDSQIRRATLNRLTESVKRLEITFATLFGRMTRSKKLTLMRFLKITFYQSPSNSTSSCYERLRHAILSETLDK